MRLASGVRAVAILEAAKGLLVIAAGFALLTLVHGNAQRIAEELVHHLHLNPAKGTPRVFIELAGNLFDRRLWLPAALAGAYCAMRFIEAYGLWRARRWAEWFAAASGGVYIPFEIYELLRGVSWLKLGTLAVNVVVVAYMAYVLWQSKRDARAA
jgi:uncharacterized membrane protein (DUF2068 family)